MPPGGYSPLSDNDIPQDARGLAFTNWVASYFKHGDLSSRDFSQLKLRETDTSKKPTTDTISPEELSTITDFVPGPKCETTQVHIKFSSVFTNQTAKALLDPQVREDWGRLPVWYIYCEASSWNVHYAVWHLEEKVECSQSEISFKLIPGANHFVRSYFDPIDSF